MKNNSYFESLMQSTGMRVFLYLVILLVSSLIGVGLAVIPIANGSDLGLKIGQGISSVMSFLVPPVVFYLITRKEHRMKALGFRAFRPWWLALIGALLMVVEIPILNQVTEWGQAIHFGPAFEKLGEWMKSLSESNEELTLRMFNVSTVGGLLMNLLIMALIPAIGEEMTFRGVLQQSLARRMNPHVAILLTAAVFSFIHFEFSGFFSRMLAGILLGYMFHITGSLWVSGLMHFVNNGLLVVLYYLNNIGVIDDIDRFDKAPHISIVITCAVAMVLLLVWCWRKKSADSQA